MRTWTPEAITTATAATCPSSLCRPRSQPKSSAIPTAQITTQAASKPARCVASVQAFSASHPGCCRATARAAKTAMRRTGPPATGMALVCSLRRPSGRSTSWSRRAKIRTWGVRNRHKRNANPKATNIWFLQCWERTGGEEAETRPRWRNRSVSLRAYHSGKPTRGRLRPLG